METLILMAGVSVASPAVVPVGPGDRYEDLSAEWWQWALEEPWETNPVADAAGEDCAVDQSGRYWFLAGTLLCEAYGVCDQAGTTSDSVADGIYLLLPPMSRGPHTIDIYGEFPDWGWTIDVHYDLFVER